jgi:cytochrome c-type biogenesis protein|uniref:Cytochrome c biogenesis protein transmembrane region n=1 Tax=Palmaria decipiens TaxID=187399 RepID=A0A6C0W5A6_PALDE|nr:cytochrome c biogenesis protein transmembrane region [Palmaria decipiens]QIC19445.1 cytochrome c biogenesis protein transmembrane region [Palmaria decipiens]
MDPTTVELYIFFVQQSLNQLVSQQINSVTIISSVIIFTGGVLTSFNPCMLSTLPLTLAYLSQHKASSLYYLNFITGLMLSLLITSSFFLIVQHSSLIILNTLPILRPLMLITTGLSLLKLINIPNIGRRSLSSHHKSKYPLQEVFWAGLFLGFTLSPCSAPIFITLLTWITYTRKLAIGAFFVSIYMFGYIFPILLSMVSVYFLKKIQSCSTQMYSIVPFSGFVITTTGMFSIFHIFFNQVIL